MMSNLYGSQSYLGNLILLLILVVFVLIFTRINSTEEIIAIEPSEEQLKQSIQAKVNLTEELIATFLDAWGINEDNVTINLALLPHDITLITISYVHFLIRFYVKWGSDKVTVSIAQNGKKFKISKRTFSLKEHKMAFEKILRFFKKKKPAVLNIFTPADLDKIQELIASKILEQKEDEESHE